MNGVLPIKSIELNYKMWNLFLQFFGDIAAYFGGPKPLKDESLRDRYLLPNHYILT